MLKNIKSLYILKQIFRYIPNGKYLKIVIHNKNLQKKLNISIDTYIRYSNQIEIEILFNINKFFNDKYNFGRIYHVSNENEEIFYHCEEIELENTEKNFGKFKFKLLIDSEVKSISKLFLRCRCVEEIKFVKFNRTDFIDYKFLFSGCDKLINLDISKIKTDKVIDMSYMFKECKSLEKLDISNFKTQQTTNMSHMFDGCTSLKELNISTFNTKNVTDMSYMFKFCKSLMKLDLSNFNTIKVNNMKELFLGCSSLKELNISNFIFNNSTDIQYMFGDCSEELKNSIRNKFINLGEIAFKDKMFFFESID